MKNADIKAKNSLSHEVIWYISPVGFFGGNSKHHKNPWIAATYSQNETAELRKWTHWAASSIPIQKLER